MNCRIQSYGYENGFQLALILRTVIHPSALVRSENVL